MGSSRFYVALDDELMRIFGGDRIRGMMERFKIDDDTPIEAGILTASIERSQKKVESHHYEQRKHVLEYDDVMNKQRAVVYAERRRVLEGHNLRPSLTEIVGLKAREAVETNCPDNVHPHEWDRAQIISDLETMVRGISKRVNVEQLEKPSKDEMVELLAREGDQIYTDKETRFGEHYRDQLPPEQLHEGLRILERATMLQIIDRLWIDHLYTMDSLKQGIGLRGWGQKDPRVEYEREAFDLFEALKAAIQEEFLTAMYQGDDFHVVIQAPPPQADAAAQAQPLQVPGDGLPPPDTRALQRFNQLHTNRDDAGGGAQPIRRSDKIGRNDPCPCGSGKKYKKCHGAVAV
jgi:preprotein translocase subunit SecA